MITDEQLFCVELRQRIALLPEINKSGLELAKEQHPYRWETFVDEVTTRLEQEWAEHGKLYRREHQKFVEIINSSRGPESMYTQCSIPYQSLSNMRKGISPGNHDLVNILMVMELDYLL